jgi:pSer/pThr/pTyr-binding forkhead associated (FHA) protein
MATLIVTEGPGTGQRFALARHHLVMIGRDASCTIQLVDPQLSRNHLQIELVEAENRHYALDFNSKNGVVINGQKIDKRTPLRDCDVIQIGDCSLVYTTDDSADAQQVRDSAKRYGQGHVRTMVEDQ